MSRSLVLTASLLVPASLADAGVCLSPTDVKRESGYAYVVGLADALTYAASGLERASRIGAGESQNGGPDVAGFDVLLAIKLSTRDYKCAAMQVEPYMKSSSQPIQASAKGATGVFSTLASLNDRSAKEYSDSIDAAAAGNFKPGTTSARIADLAVFYDETWKLLVTAVIMGTYAVVEADQSTGLISGLAMTPAQRDDVLKRLHQTFGNQIDHGLQTGQTSLVAAASVLYQVVGERKRRLRAAWQPYAPRTRGWHSFRNELPSRISGSEPGHGLVGVVRLAAKGDVPSRRLASQHVGVDVMELQPTPLASGGPSASSPLRPASSFPAPA